MDANQTADDFLAKFSTSIAENKAPLALRYLMLAASLPISDRAILVRLIEQANSRKANEIVQNALERTPLRQHDAELQLFYANALSKRGQYEMACDTYLALVDHEDHGAVALHALGPLALYRGEIDAALGFARQLQQRDPAKQEGYLLEARIHSEIGAYDKARAAIAKAEDIAPLKQPPGFMVQRQAIEGGDFAAMFQHLYSNREKPPHPLSTIDVPFLKNLEDARGKNLVVFGEQGFGDVLQFCRYIPQLNGVADYLGYYVHQKLRRFLRQIGLAGVDLYDKNLPSRCPDYLVPLMDLPHLLGATSIDASPYLAAEPQEIDRWRARIGAGGFKIGIVWQGNAEAAIDIGRSIPLLHLARLAEIEGVRLISLQKGTGIEQIAALPRHDIIEVFEDLDSGPDAFIDTAAAASCLDLVVTIDTSVSHVVGALGLPAVLLAKCYPDWRWTFPPTDRSVWYANTKIIRQPAPDDWSGAVDALMIYVKERMQNAKPTAH